MFTGRDKELELLGNKYNSKKSELLIVYGRRRVGKTVLIKTFLNNKKKNSISFEAVESEHSNVQIINLANEIISFLNDKYIDKSSFKSWDSVFSYLTDKILSNKKRKNKFVLFFDEFQWMASSRNRLVSIVKYFWDNYWKDNNVMLILCGSIASFMVKKVIKSKALYGRISTEILLKGLKPNEAIKIFRNKRSKVEVLKYLLLFGGIPKYLEEIDLTRSFNYNINSLCFSSNSFMIAEVEKIFYSQFKEGTTYIRIVKFLKNNLLTQSEISSKLNRKSGGSLKEYLQNLENAEMIKGFNSFDKNWKKKYLKYRLTDEFLNFNFKYIEPNNDIISESNNNKLFELLIKDSFTIWMGFAFERFCVKNAMYIAEKLGFSDEVISYGPYFSKSEKKFQIDLIYKRADNIITVCEVKYHSKEISASIIKDMEQKLSLLNTPKGFTIEKALISLYGQSKQLKESEYFDYNLTLDDIFK